MGIKFGWGKLIWIVALVIPGGFIAMGIWLLGKATYENIKNKKL